MRIFSFVLIIFLFFRANALDLNIEFFNKFNDKYLPKYIMQSLEKNHDLRKTKFTIEQHRNNIKVQFSKELPELSVSASFLGTHFPKLNKALFDSTMFILPFFVSYEADLLLKNRDKTKSKKRLYLAQLANQKGVYISYFTDIFTTYLNIILYDFIIEKQKELLENKILELNLYEKKFNFGIINLKDLNKIQKEKEEIIKELENLEKNRKTILYDFCVLLGQSSENFEDIKRGDIENFEFQDKIPTDFNSNVICNRPDIMELEEKLKAAKIDIRVAKKEFLPNFSLSGFLGFDSSGGGNFFSWESSVAYLLLSATQDLFKGGYKIANLRIKKAKYDELFEEYKQKDLNAIKEIINTLNLIKKNENIEKSSKKELKIELVNLILEKEKFKMGINSKLEILENQNEVIKKQITLAKTKSQRLINYGTLYKALGGNL